MMVLAMREIGRMIRCMDRVYSITEVLKRFMMANSLRINFMVLVISIVCSRSNSMDNGIIRILVKLMVIGPNMMEILNLIKNMDMEFSI